MELTTKECGLLIDAMALEEAAQAKFSYYAGHAGDSAIRKLCAQLADRSREHYAAVLAQVDGAGKRQ